MGKVTGIGGVFLKCEDATKMNEWYSKHLGIPVTKWGGATFQWRTLEDPENLGSTAWCTFAKDTDYMQPSEKPFMINYRVENLTELLEQLKAEGIEMVGAIQEFEYGRFAWIMDPEGHKIELWEPVPVDGKL